MFSFGKGFLYRGRRKPTCWTIESKSLLMGKCWEAGESSRLVAGRSFLLPGTNTRIIQANCKCLDWVLSNDGFCPWYVICIDVLYLYCTSNYSPPMHMERKRETCFLKCHKLIASSPMIALVCSHISEINPMIFCLGCIYILTPYIHMHMCNFWQ